jgi:hypothetical protein
MDECSHEIETYGLCAITAVFMMRTLCLLEYVQRCIGIEFPFLIYLFVLILSNGDGLLPLPSDEAF